MSYMFEILPSLLNGASMTLQVFALVLIFSIPLGIVVAFALQVRWKPLHYLIDLYIWVMRGTPLLLQLIFIYYVLPSIGIPFDTVRYIILPQVTKIVLPSVFNEIMSLVKDTSLVYALGISDLILASRTAANRDASLVPMFLAGAIYLIMIGLVTIVAKKLEKKYSYYR